MARAVLLSGSYMLYARHRAAPPPEAFEGLRLDVPNISGRMDNLRAAILRPQIAHAARPGGALASAVPRAGGGAGGHAGPAPDPAPASRGFVGSSFQFLLPDWDARRRCAAWSRGLRRGGWS